jgi:hypothetical protein
MSTSNLESILQTVCNSGWQLVFDLSLLGAAGLAVVVWWLVSRDPASTFTRDH